MNTTNCKAIVRSGTVIAHSTTGLVVDVSSNVACQRCAEGRGCGVGLLARRQPHTVIDPGGLPSHYANRYPLGSLVSFTVEKSDVSVLALLVYALPLLFSIIISGAAAGRGVSDWFCALLFFSTLIVSMVILKYLLRGRVERFRPRLVS
ncbi:SoxR reducing system RseC family protein [Halomonas qinghailakensis]|uniref:SoxR reducing system RseC family protein n=2 Tax=Halomonas TaxID=2745 RepID=A0AA46TPK9_9GAMM|nr:MULTISPECIES: SoxR reducing system RseC family protein [Halomonas]UYO74205.1 SoxR reducing system RseC family protein [Halomonas sp. ZZQ-149]UYV17776.1 SoxR reducing system RseC family protein [Halomonas qaidamensis]